MATPPSHPHERMPDEPATVEDIRTLRRWLLVVGVWAAAATAVALIALVTSGGGSSDGSASSKSEIAQVQQRLTGRLDNVEQQLDEKAPTEDLQKLQDRLQKVEDDLPAATDKADQAAQDLQKLQDRVDELATRVEDLEAGGGSPSP